MFSILLAAAISMSGCKTSGGIYRYELDVGGLTEDKYEWVNGERPLVGWQSYVEDDAGGFAAVTNMSKNAGGANNGGLYLWATNDLFAIGTRTGSGRDRYLGCIFINDTAHTVSDIALVTQCAQAKATNTETDLVILEYAIAADISTIMDGGLTWNRYHVFYSPVVSGLLPGELPSYENPVTTRIDSVPKGSCIAFRWRDHSPASGGNASFAYTVFRLDFVPKTGAYLYLR